MSNPVTCVALGDALLFDVSSGCYPVYQRDSLLNSNAQFDYGPFRDLAAAMKSNSAAYSTFGFVFSTPGAYVFSSSCATTATAGECCYMCLTFAGTRTGFVYPLAVYEALVSRSTCVHVAHALIQVHGVIVRMSV